MPLVYKRKTERATRTPIDVLKRAARAVEDGQSLRGAANDFSVDKMTLKRFIAKKRNDATAVTGYGATKVANMVFSPPMERDLADHVKALADMFYGLSLEKCRQLAYQFAAKNDIKFPASWAENKKAGKDWWLGFKRRHDLSIRSPEATSLGRATAFNRHTAGEFYDNLAGELDRYQFRPEDIYNLDETGCRTVQNPRNIVTQTGKKQVGSVTSAERGELVTVVYTINASGQVLPPMFIFPRKNFRDHFINGGPPGCIGKPNQSGWINEQLFIEYLQHIIRNTRCTKERKILLILDNHESHVSVAAIDLAKDNGIVMLTIPPHTSHRLQPLDRCVYGPFKSTYCRAMDAWMRNHPGRTITIYDIPNLVKEAQLQAMTPRNILSGFEKTGIFPYNRDLFTEEDFAPAQLTDRALPAIPEIETPLVPEPVEAPAVPPEVSDGRTIFGSPQPGTSNDVPPTDTYPNPLTSDTLMPTTPTAPARHSADSGKYVSPDEIYVLPKAQERKTKRRSRKGKTKVLTATPVRNELAAQKEQRMQKKNLKTRKALFVKKNTPATNENTGDTSTSEDEDIVFDDSSDDEPLDDEVIEGDFVVVKVCGKSRIVNYIARIDAMEDGEYEGVFLKKVSGRVGSEDDLVFIPNESDDASFLKEDIICKLPSPKVVGGSKRRANHLLFRCNLAKWDLQQA
ncbi:Uncharacterised protein r2_g465 [Pycnogonum litorale]